MKLHPRSASIPISGLRKKCPYCLNQGKVIEGEQILKKGGLLCYICPRCEKMWAYDGRWNYWDDLTLQFLRPFVRKGRDWGKDPPSQSADLREEERWKK